MALKKLQATVSDYVPREVLGGFEAIPKIRGEGWIIES